MDKITVITNIIRSSLLFDCDIQNNKYDMLNTYNEKIANLLIDLHLSPIEEEMLKLCEYIHNINNNIIDKISHRKISKLDTKKNTFIFFYKENCKYSMLFIPEWKKMKNLLDNKFNMVSINCDKIKYKNICNFFRVYEYPTIKLVTSHKIIDYFGEMNCDSIINELFNNKNLNYKSFEHF